MTGGGAHKGLVPGDAEVAQAEPTKPEVKPHQDHRGRQLERVVAGRVV